MKELIEKLRYGYIQRVKRWSGDMHAEFSSGEVDVEATDDVMSQAADTIERLENELTVASIRIENDAREIVRLDQGWNEASVNVLLLTQDLQYIAGIVEKGLGVKAPDDMNVRAAVLGYAQELEMTIEQISACLKEEQMISNELALERDVYQQAADTMAAAHKVELEKRCNCEFDGDVNTVQCTLHNAWAETLNEQASYRRERDDHAQQLRKEQLEVQALAAEVASLKLDAGRYRWLRDQDDSADVFCMYGSNGIWGECGHTDIYGELLDTTIDASMKGVK